MSHFPEDYPRTTALIEAILRPDTHTRPATERTELFDRLHRSGCLPIFYAYSRHIDHPIPDPAHDHWRNHRTRQALYRRKLAKITDTLTAADIPFVVLKGEPLSKLLFDDPRLRFSSDIDLLVPPSEIDNAHESLNTLGYETRSNRPREPWNNNQLRLVHRRTASSLELHWRIAYPYVPAPNTDVFLQNSTEIALDGLSLPSLNPEWSFIQICYNFHHDQGTLKALLDLAGWLDRFPPHHDATRAAEPLGPVQATALAQWPTDVLEVLTGREIPLDLPHSRPAVQLWKAVTTREIRRRYIELAEPTFTSRAGRTIKPLRTLTFALRRSLSLLLFSDWPTHPTRLLHPVALGRHRLGRTVAKLLNLPATTADQSD